VGADLRLSGGEGVRRDQGQRAAAGLVTTAEEFDDGGVDCPSPWRRQRAGGEFADALVAEAVVGGSIVGMLYQQA